MYSSTSCDSDTTCLSGTITAPCGLRTSTLGVASSELAVKSTLNGIGKYNLCSMHNNLTYDSSLEGAFLFLSLSRQYKSHTFNHVVHYSKNESIIVKQLHLHPHNIENKLKLQIHNGIAKTYMCGFTGRPNLISLNSPNVYFTFVRTFLQNFRIRPGKLRMKLKLLRVRNTSEKLKSSPVFLRREIIKNFMPRPAWYNSSSSSSAIDTLDLSQWLAVQGAGRSKSDLKGMNHQI